MGIRVSCWIAGLKCSRLPVKCRGIGGHRNWIFYFCAENKFIHHDGGTAESAAVWAR